MTFTSRVLPPLPPPWCPYLYQVYLHPRKVSLKSEQEFNFELPKPPVTGADLKDKASIRQGDRVPGVSGPYPSDGVKAIDVGLDADDLDIVFAVRDLAKVAALLEVEGAEGRGLPVSPEGLDGVVALVQVEVELGFQLEPFCLVQFVVGVPADFAD